MITNESIELKEIPVIKPDPVFGYITLNNGKHLDLQNPRSAHMDLDIIANALSHLCRFSGQTDHFYSVAQHSVLVSYLTPKEHAFTGLMHDATEAFCADVPKPIKQLLPEYNAVEERLWGALACRYNLPFVIPDEVHKADRIALITEAKELLPRSNWEEWYPELEPIPQGLLDLNELLRPWKCGEAMLKFTKRYHSLIDKGFV